jgi:hypothetical protein
MDLFGGLSLDKFTELGDLNLTQKPHFRRDSRIDELRELEQSNNRKELKSPLVQADESTPLGINLVLSIKIRGTQKDPRGRIC